MLLRCQNKKNKNKEQKHGRNCKGPNFKCITLINYVVTNVHTYTQAYKHA